MTFMKERGGGRRKGERWGKREVERYYGPGIRNRIKIENHIVHSSKHQKVMFKWGIHAYMTPEINKIQLNSSLLI